MNQREQTLALALGGVAAIFIGRWLVMDVVLAPIREKQTRLERAEEDLDQKQFQTTVQQAAIESLRKWKLDALPESQNGGNASVLYKGYLVDLLQKAGIKNPNITPVPVRKVRNAYSTLPFSISLQSDLPQLAKLLYEFKRTDLLQAIKTIDVRPEINNDKIEFFNTKLDVEVLAFSDAKGRVTLEPGGKSDGHKLEEFQFMAKKNVFQPTSLVDRQKAIEMAARDDRPSVTFYGTVTQTNEKHRSAESYEFYNSAEREGRRSFSRMKGEELDFAGFKGKILGYDTETDEVVLQSGAKILGVRKGKTISTAKERGVPPASMSLASQPIS